MPWLLWAVSGRLCHFSGPITAPSVQGRIILKQIHNKWYCIYRIHGVELVLNLTFIQIVPWKPTPLPYWIYTVEHRCVPSPTIMEGLQKEDK